jgi:hypothetical protein
MGFIRKLKIGYHFFQIGAGIALAPFTGGATLLPVAYSVARVPYHLIKLDEEGDLEF